MIGIILLSRKKPESRNFNGKLNYNTHSNEEYICKIDVFSVTEEN